MIAAISNEKKFHHRQRVLYWVDTEAKTCHKCGSAEHLVKDCKEREESFERKQHMTRYSKIYNRYKVPNYRNNNNFYRNNRVQ